MRTLTNAEVSLMENLIGITQTGLREVLYKFLQKYYKDVRYDPDYLIAVGDIPIALVAHMDTVFKSPATEVFYDRKKNVMWSPTGAGFDDRAGVFAILQIVKSGLRPHIIFTTDEEIGCVGASIVAELPCPFSDLRFIIQLDRRNGNDCVFYNCDNEEFQKYIESFGFVTAYGSFTDISELCPAWEVAGVNFSIGYRDEHTTSEILFVGQMLNTIDKTKTILKQTDIPYFKYIPAVGAFNWKSIINHANAASYDTEYWRDYESGYNDFYAPTTWKLTKPSNARYICYKCGKSCKEDEVLDVKLIKGGTGYICDDCLLTNVEWCRHCGSAFEIDPKHPDDLICPACRKKGIKHYGKPAGNNKKSK